MLDSMVDAVGIEPTTCRLRVKVLPFSTLLGIAIYCLLSARYEGSVSCSDCGYYPQFRTFLKQYTHKSPHSDFDKFRSKSGDHSYTDAYRITSNADGTLNLLQPSLFLDEVVHSLRQRCTANLEKLFVVRRLPQVRLSWNTLALQCGNSLLGNNGGQIFTGLLIADATVCLSSPTIRNPFVAGYPDDTFAPAIHH